MYNTKQRCFLIEAELFYASLIVTLNSHCLKKSPKYHFKKIIAINAQYPELQYNRCTIYQSLPTNTLSI